MQIGRTILPPTAKTTNFLSETLREDTSTYIFCFPLEQSLARTTDSGRVVGNTEVIRLLPYLPSSGHDRQNFRSTIVEWTTIPSQSSALRVPVLMCWVVSIWPTTYWVDNTVGCGCLPLR